MYLIYLIAFMAAAYLLGSLNPAITITRLKAGVDIRTLGSHNPGTSNVRRNLGMVWGALVLLLDIAKGLIPVVVAKNTCFPDNSFPDFSALALTGMAAITGHCKPVWHQFKGGGGIATSIGILLYFIPVEFFVSMLIGFVTTLVFFRRKKYSVGQITPMIFIPLTPFVILATSFLGKNTLHGVLAFGGHEWFVVTGIFAISLLIFILNLSFVTRRIATGDTHHN
jgi:glycerol-3-phosphate acyltransferase PlsY